MFLWHSSQHGLCKMEIFKRTLCIFLFDQKCSEELCIPLFSLLNSARCAFKLPTSNNIGFFRAYLSIKWERTIALERRYYEKQSGSESFGSGGREGGQGSIPLPFFFYIEDTRTLRPITISEPNASIAKQDSCCVFCTIL